MDNAQILVIDDNVANLTYLISILSEVGYRVQPAKDGETSIRIALKAPPDLVLLDVRMEGMDGFEVGRRFKALPALADIPIIFISAMDDVDGKVEAFRVGAVDYITKPIQPQEVLARVDKELRARQLLAQARHIAALEERQRIARDLHDAVNQTLFSLSLEAETALRNYDTTTDETLGALQSIHKHAQTAMTEMRALMFELRPQNITRARLGDLLTTLATSVTSGQPVQLEVDVECDYKLPPDMQINIYRIVQEALTNVIKHARASRVDVRLFCASDNLLLMIEDNGQGFDMDKRLDGHYGLQNMRERAAALGAVIEIESSPGEGAVLQLSIEGLNLDE